MDRRAFGLSLEPDGRSLSNFKPFWIPLEHSNRVPPPLNSNRFGNIATAAVKLELCSKKKGPSVFRLTTLSSGFTTGVHWSSSFNELRPLCSPKPSAILEKPESVKRKAIGQRMRLIPQRVPLSFVAFSFEAISS